MKNLGLIDEHLVAKNEGLVAREQIASNFIHVNEWARQGLIVLLLSFNFLMPLFVENALMVLLVLLECEHVLPVFWERFMILDHI